MTTSFAKELDQERTLENNLHSLLRNAFDRLMVSEPNSEDRHRALVTIERTQRDIIGHMHERRKHAARAGW